MRLLRVSHYLLTLNLRAPKELEIQSENHQFENVTWMVNLEKAHLFQKGFQNDAVFILVPTNQIETSPNRELYQEPYIFN